MAGPIAMRFNARQLWLIDWVKMLTQIDAKRSYCVALIFKQAEFAFRAAGLIGDYPGDMWLADQVLTKLGNEHGIPSDQAKVALLVQRRKSRDEALAFGGYRQEGDGGDAGFSHLRDGRFDGVDLGPAEGPKALCGAMRLGSLPVQAGSESPRALAAVVAAVVAALLTGVGQGVAPAVEQEPWPAGA